MKRLYAILFLSFICITGQSALSQITQKKPGYFVFHQNKVSNENMARANALLDSMSTPILNELVKEGKLISWGQLMHSWGDEWNFNFFFITESQRSFLDFWDEYIARFNKRFPNGWSVVGPLISDHKDNMYEIRRMQTGQTVQ